MKRNFWIAGFVLICAAAAAQTATNRRVSGTVESADGNTISVKRQSGDTMTVHLTGNVAVYDVSKGAMADLKPNAFIGVGAMPQADGSQRAMQITVFSESQRGLGEGHRPWDRAPNSTMTNGTVDTTVGSVEGSVLTVKYKGGDKKIVVPSDAVILVYSLGDKSKLKPGVKIAVIGAKQRADGTFDADRVNVGHGDIMPR